MKKFLIIPIFLLLAGTGIYLSFQNKVPSNTLPQPIEGTQVKLDMEEKNLLSNRHDWIQAMHRADEGTDWRKIEYRNSIERQENRQNKPKELRDGEEVFADGLLSGEWLERGSNNQAGSVFEIEYDVESNMIYLVSAGGSIFKTEFDFQYWEVVNDKFRFTPGILELVKMENGKKRMIALIDKVPHFSDDEGITWEKASSYNTTNWASVKDACMANINGQELIFILAKTDYWNDFNLYVSKDLGANYTNIKNFNTSNSNNLAMAHIKGSNEVYLIEQIGANTSILHKYMPEDHKMHEVRENSPHAFGQNGRGNLTGVAAGDSLRLLSYNADNELFASVDTGATWTYLSTLPITPWNVRLYVSHSNPDLLLTGGVDCYRSLNGGKAWQQINYWWEYYDDVTYKLHADIMHFDEFTDQYGDEFVTISNHGGLSISYDNTITNVNIGEYDLNVCQYYSVRTSPSRDDFVMAGSQDQGLQRGFLNGQFTSNFEQVISGDYGHNVFTLGGEAFWTVYPGGWVSHYSNPLTGYLDASFDLESQNETVWIPPIVAGPDPGKDQVVMAGGNMNGGSGSYLILLTYQNQSIIKEQLPFNFMDASNSEISAIGISPINPDKWYVATNNGQLYYSNDRGQTFTKSQSEVPGSHYLYGACILPSSLDEDVVYISGSGYSTAPVIKSENGGQSFFSMRNGLPSTLMFGIACNEDESLFFGATENGPYVYVSQEEKWYDLAGETAPAQSYWTVEYISSLKTARFGTYGRGIWDFKVANAPVASEETSLSFADFKVYPNPGTGPVFVELNERIKDFRLECMDINGRMLVDFEGQRTGPLFTWNLANLDAGVYFITLYSGASKVTRKIIRK